jgi:hypothetical protein
MNLARHAMAALAAACLVAACGGGADTLPMPYTTVAAVPAPTHVRIEGCVLDITDRPLALPVHASAEDGRLLASALTDNDGVFRMHVPARQRVRLAAATPGAEPLDVMTGNVQITVAGCLRPAVA